MNVKHFTLLFVIVWFEILLSGCSSNNHQDKHQSTAIITDPITGLMWRRCLEGLSGNNCLKGQAHKMPYKYAIQYPNYINQSGTNRYNDWRLPTINELKTLIKEKEYEPMIDTAKFPTSTLEKDNLYTWSSTLLHDDPKGVWSVYFGTGYAYYDDRTSSHRTVRLVRGNCNKDQCLE